jgi:hypothetical protein
MESIGYRTMINGVLLQAPDIVNDLDIFNQRITQLLKARGDIQASVTRAKKVESDIIFVCYHASIAKDDMMQLIKEQWGDVLVPKNIEVEQTKISYQNHVMNSASAGFNEDESGIDTNIRVLVDALNCIPNVKTFSSCDGHYKYNYYVLWIHTDENMRVLNAILKSLNNIANRLFVQHFDTTEKNQLQFTFRCGFDSWTKENHKGYFGEYENIPYFELRIGMNRMEKFPESFYLFTHQLSAEFAKEVNEISWTSL